MFDVLRCSVDGVVLHWVGRGLLIRYFDLYIPVQATDILYYVWHNHGTVSNLVRLRRTDEGKWIRSINSVGKKVDCTIRIMPFDQRFSASCLRLVSLISVDRFCWTIWIWHLASLASNVPIRLKFECNLPTQADASLQINCRNGTSPKGTKETVGLVQLDWPWFWLFISFFPLSPLETATYVPDKSISIQSPMRTRDD